MIVYPASSAVQPLRGAVLGRLTDGQHPLVVQDLLDESVIGGTAAQVLLRRPREVVLQTVGADVRVSTGATPFLNKGYGAGQQTVGAQGAMVITGVVKLR